MSGPEVLIPMTFFLSAAAFFILRGPLGKAIADAISGRARTQLPGPSAERVEQLEAELDEVNPRRSEVEGPPDPTRSPVAPPRPAPSSPTRRWPMPSDFLFWNEV